MKFWTIEPFNPMCRLMCNGIAKAIFTGPDALETAKAAADALNFVAALAQKAREKNQQTKTNQPTK